MGLAVKLAKDLIYVHFKHNLTAVASEDSQVFLHYFPSAGWSTWNNYQRGEKKFQNMKLGNLQINKRQEGKGQGSIS